MVTIHIKLIELNVELARRNKTRTWLAEEMGISSGYLTQTINGNRQMSPRLRQKMQDTLGVTFDDLFYIEHV